jgi:hypothetical protein
MAALLGHRSVDMTLRYAKIATRAVADEYFAVTGKVEVLRPARPASRRRHRLENGWLRREDHHLPSNGWCTSHGRLSANRPAADRGSHDSTAMNPGTQRPSWSGASKPIRHKPVEAHMLFGSFADKTAMKLCRNTHHEPARIGAFRQRLWNWLAGCSQVGEHVTHDIG